MDVPKEVNQLKNDLIWARHYLNQYKKLFLHNQKRTDLLNVTAPRFFRDIQMMFWDEMTVSVARLMDPHIQKANRNLSLNVLLKLAKEYEWDFENELIDLIDKSKKKSMPIIARRMKLTAHRDLPTAMGEVELDKFGIEEIEKTLDLVGQVLNLMYLNVTNETWSWNLIADHDADTLVHYLKLGVVYQEMNDMEYDWKKDNELRQNSKYYNA